MDNSVAQYYRCPADSVQYKVAEPLSRADGYFRIGPDAIGFGRCSGHEPAEHAAGDLYDLLEDARIDNGLVCLPFDPGQVAHNLRFETYVEDWRSTLPLSVIAELYYWVRPILPVGIRRHLQKLHLKIRGVAPFPRWPVDSSVDDMFAQVLLQVLQAQRHDEIPFVWFWPDGAPSAAFMTHDVETELGRDYCPTLMDIDDSFGIKASFQVIPEQRYVVSGDFLDTIRSRGFEIGIHDLNHDGHLYKSREQFLERAARINAYGTEFGSDGFRAAVLYRKQLWYDALKFSFDMSVPNVATFDPQRGGCCTVMPYFVGDILELPVTMSQDYTLFNILGDYSIDVWKQQLDVLLRKNGLISCIVHPDYIVDAKERSVYQQLLAYLVRLKHEQGIWVATPKEVNRWWRAREAMNVTFAHGEWRVEGPGSDRARVAFARVEDGKLAFRVADSSVPAA
jgi:hypothetical protein